VDAFVRRATVEGAKLLRPVAHQFYGDRVGVLKDPFGHSWSFATHIEDVSPEEMKRRATAQQGG
jgi:PhnB protein